MPGVEVRIADSGESPGALPGGHEGVLQAAGCDARAIDAEGFFTRRFGYSTPTAT